MFKQAAKSLLSVSVRSRLCILPRLLHQKKSALDVPDEVLLERESDAPIEIPNPYEKPKPKCFLCEYNIEVNYKNVRLLSQFISPITGRMLRRHVTGLCYRQHRIVEVAIARAQNCALLASYNKSLKYMNDPVVFDLAKPVRRSKY